MTLSDPPAIAPATTGGNRPLVSVMVPTYNATDYLRPCLESVLAQAEESGFMEIMVVDDCSDSADAGPLVREVGRGRVAFHRNERRLGIGGCWNRCIDLARGSWVHILHSDDLVLPGFYPELRRLHSEGRAEAIAFRCRVVNAQGVPGEESPDLSGPDSAARSREEFLRRNPLQCAGVVIKRSVYERLGGFRLDFQYLLDLEMWSRVFFNTHSFFSPNCLAAHRLHADSAGARHRRAAEDAAEFFALAPLLAHNLNLSEAEMRRHRRFCLATVYHRCAELARAGDRESWLRCQRIYSAQLRGLVEKIAYAGRFGRNYRRLVRAQAHRRRAGSVSQ